MPVLLAGLAWQAYLAPRARAPIRKQELVAEALAAGADVVVLGNSTAGTDIDPRVVADALDLSAPPAVLHVDGSMAPGWLAALDGGVFGQGHRPRLVILVGAIDWIVTTGFSSTTQRLDAQAFSPEGSRSAALLFGGQVGPLGSARSRGAELHTALREAIRDASVGLVFGGEGDGLMAAGRATAVPAAAAVFGDMRPRSGAPQSALNVVEEVPGGAEPGYALDVVRGIVELVHEHGAHVVFVRIPDRPSDPASGPARALEPALLTLLNELGAGWIDLSGLVLGQDGFADGLHMNRVGRAALNAELGPLLAKLDPLHRERLPPAAPRVTAGLARRVGEIGALPGRVRPGKAPCTQVVEPVGLEFLSDAQLRDRGLGRASPLRVSEAGVPILVRAANREALNAGCTGTWFGTPRGAIEVATRAEAAPEALTLTVDPALPLNEGRSDEAWWVYPGTAVELAVQNATSGTLRLRLRALGGGVPTALAGDRPVPLTAAGEDYDGELDLTGLPADWTLRVQSAAGGPWVLIEGAEVERAGDRRVLLGELVPSVRIGGRSWSFPAAPAPLPAPRWEAAGPGRWTAELPGLAHVGSDGPRGTGFEGCTPVRVEVDGALIPVRPRTLGEPGSGVMASSFREGRLSVDFPTLPDPRAKVVLDPGRRCAGALWLYPGETVDTRDRDPGVGGLRHGAGSARVRLRVLGPAAPGETVEIVVANKVTTFLSARIPLAGLADAPLELPLDAPLADGMGGLTTRFVSHAAQAFVLVERVELLDAGPTPPP